MVNELLNSEVGLVRNLLVLHNTKNLEEEIPYLIFIAHELIHDRNKSDVSIRRIREFFAVKSPSAIESALKVLIARGILKVNEEKQRYGFSTMFYFDFFRSQATEVRLHEVSIQLQAERKQDNEEMSMDPMSLQYIRQYFKEAAPEVQNEFLAGLAINAKDKEALKSLLGTSQSGNIFNGKTTINHVNIQSITNTLNEIITANDRTVLIKGIQELPRLSNYLPQLLDNAGEVDVSEDSISRAMDNYVADMEESLESITLQSPRAGDDFAEATINSGYNTSISSSYAAVLGVSDDEYEEFMEQYNLPEFFLRSLGFAHQLDELFMRGAVGDDIDKIDFSPVTIMYCKLIESLLKEYHISIYGNSFESLDTDMRKPENKDEKRLNDFLNDYMEWSEIKKRKNPKKGIEEGKHITFVSCDSQSMSINPFHRVYRFCGTDRPAFMYYFFHTLAALNSLFQLEDGTDTLNIYGSAAARFESKVNIQEKLVIRVVKSMHVGQEIEEQLQGYYKLLFHSVRSKNVQ